MEVTDVLRDRREEPAGLQKMLAASIAAHVLLAAIALLAPGRWMNRPSDARRADKSGEFNRRNGRPRARVRPLYGWGPWNRVIARHHRRLLLPRLYRDDGGSHP